MLGLYTKLETYDNFTFTQNLKIQFLSDKQSVHIFVNNTQSHYGTTYM